MNSINHFWKRVTARSSTDNNNNNQMKLKAKVRRNIVSESNEPEKYDLHQDIWIRCMKEKRLERLQNEKNIEAEKMLETSNNSIKLKRTISNPKMKKNAVFVESRNPTTTTNQTPPQASLFR